MSGTTAGARPGSFAASPWGLPAFGAVCLGLLLGIAATGTPTAALLTLGAFLAAAAAVALLATTGRLADALFVAVFALLIAPIDKHFFAVEHAGGWPGLRVSAADLALYALAPLLLLRAWLSRNQIRLPGALVAVYGCWLLQYLLSTVGAPHRNLAAFEVAAAAHALVTCLVVAAAFRWRHVRTVLLVLLVALTVHTALAVAQAATGRPVGAGWFKGGTIVQETLESGEVRLRPSGLFGHPIVYADMLMLMVPLFTAGLFLRSRAWFRLPMIAGLGIAVLGLALTLARGAWISTVVALLVMGVLAVRLRLLTAVQWKQAAIAGGVAVTIAAAAFGPRVYERLTASDSGNLSVRFELNWIAIAMLERHPVAGVGVNNFIEVMEGYDPNDVMKRFPATVHNVYLLEAAEAGLPGLLLFLGVFGVVLRDGFRRLPLLDDPDRQWIAIALLGGVCGFLCSQLADFSHRLEPFRSLLWACIGLLYATVGPAVRRPRGNRT